MTDLRSLIADTLTAHRAVHSGTVVSLPGPVYCWGCQCGAGRSVDDALPGAEGWERAVDELLGHETSTGADAILSALDGHLWPSGIQERWREADCPGEDCRRHGRGQHTHIRDRIEWHDGAWYAGPWRPVESEAAGGETP